MIKIVKENPDIEVALKKVMDFLDSKDYQASMFATMMVTGKSLGEFILKKHNMYQLPREIQYFIAMAWNQYAMIFCADKLIDTKMNIDHQDYFESGCIDDRFAMIVKQLYEICKDEKLL